MTSHMPLRADASPTPTRPANAPDSEVREAFAKAQSEMEGVFQEAIQLESQRTLDEVTTKRVEAQLQCVSTKLDKNLADRIAEIDARYAPPKQRVLPTPYRLPTLVVVVFLVTGVAFEITIGQGFIFSGSTEYRAAMPWLFGVLIPTFGLGWLFHERATHGLRTRYPTRFVRWLIVLPLLASLTTTIVVVAPLGWAALLGRSMGTPVARVEVSVLSIDAPSRSSRGCDQHAELAFRDSSARICLEGRLSAFPPRTGDLVMASGRISSLGLFIDRIDHQ